jgi:uncharacterized protein (DUF433 family)
LDKIDAGRTIKDVLADHPYLERVDVLQALRYAPGLPRNGQSTLPPADSKVE